MALVHKLKDYSPQPLILIVDHALRAGSAHEAQQAKTFAENLGLKAKVLTWTHDNPVTGLQEKARKARYGLLGNACRNAGIRYLLTGHTEDDQAETLLMRYDRNTDWRGAAGMASNVYAPVWPALAGVTLIRPLLEESRESLRAYNDAQGLLWTEDPSNESRDFSRILARDYLASRQCLKRTLLSAAKDIAQARRDENDRLIEAFHACEFGEAGEIIGSAIPSLEFLRLAMMCVSGQGEGALRSKLRKRRQDLKNGTRATFTLSGGQARWDGTRLILSRDPVAATGRRDGGLNASAVAMSIATFPQVWDGRFIVSSMQSGYTVRTSHGLTLPKTPCLIASLKSLPKSVRPTAPIITDGAQAYSPAEVPDVAIESLAESRLYHMLSL